MTQLKSKTTYLLRIKIKEKSQIACFEEPSGVSLFWRRDAVAKLLQILVGLLKTLVQKNSSKVEILLGAIALKDSPKMVRKNLLYQKSIIGYFIGFNDV